MIGWLSFDDTLIRKIVCDESQGYVVMKRAQQNTLHGSCLRVNNHSLCWLIVLVPLSFECRELIAQNDEIVEAERVVVSEIFAPIPNAYAENDYAQKRPLLDALELGFRHIEADTFLIDDRLLIGNSVLDMQSKGTLEGLYLAPIEELIRKRSDLVASGTTPLRLVVDIKSDAESTYRALRLLLEKYASILTKVVDGQLTSGSISVIVSGNYPRETIMAERLRYVAMDGRISDLDSDAPTHLIPMISARWGSHFRWQGRSEMTKLEDIRLNILVERAHVRKRMIRFWSTPDVDIVWTTLRKANVDLLGAERYALLSSFLVPRKSPFESESDSEILASPK